MNLPPSTPPPPLFQPALGPFSSSAPPSTPPPPPSFLSDGTLQQHLQALIDDASESWTYAIFWQSSVDAATGTSFLDWGDGYYNGCDEDLQKGRRAATSAAEQEHRKRVLKELNSLITGAPTADDTIDEEVTDTEWFFLVSMTQSFVNGAGLPGLAYFSGSPAWIVGGDRLMAAPCERTRNAQELGLQTMACVPVAGSGVLELGSTRVIYQSSEIMSKIGVLFSFNVNGISWAPQVAAASPAPPIVPPTPEPDPAALWISDPTEISVSKLPFQFNNSTTQQTLNQQQQSQPLGGKDFHRSRL